MGGSNSVSLDAFLALESRVAAAEKLLAGLPPEQRRLDIAGQPIAAIIADAAEALGLDARAVSSEQREPWLIRARFAIAWTAREALGSQYARIARALGRSDHTTARHQVQRAIELRARDKAFLQLTDRLLASAEHRRDAR